MTKVGRQAGACVFKEETVDERSRIIISTALGAAVGALVGYFYMTEGGARVRAQIEPRLDDFVQEVRHLRGTVEKARLAANEGWQSLNDLVGAEETGRPGWSGATRQSSH